MHGFQERHRPARARPAGVTARRLAHANLARQRAPLEAPVMRQFVAALDPVNRIAEGSPGFAWRLRSSERHGATVRQDGSGPVVVNLSVWESYEALHAFVYHSPHGAYLRRRARWFEPIRQPSTVLWWVEADERPTVDEALRRLRHLQAHGPSPQAFSLRRRFERDGRPTRRTRGRAGSREPVR
jgi:Domain of unknown function (DUF3291)